MYAEELSAAAILKALRRGRVYVTKSPRLTFQAEIGGTTYMIGDDLGGQSGEIEVTATISHGTDQLHAQLIRNGEIIAKKLLRGLEASVQFRVQVDPNRSDWCRLEVLDRNWQALVITNPIFVNSRESGIPNTRGASLW
ncbi:unnamed protein product [marine sediment metagenome]|uniref:Uncharacterized protein n=1 Tax=marine sediment metagenome TaxID=412755 RepID=X1IQM8_9ZZZZ